MTQPQSALVTPPFKPALQLAKYRTSVKIIIEPEAAKQYFYSTMFSFKGGEYLEGDFYERVRPLRVPPDLINEGQVCTAMFRLDSEWGFALPVRFVRPPHRHPSGVYVGGIVDLCEPTPTRTADIVPVKLHREGQWDHPKLKVHGRLAIEAYFLDTPGEMDEELESMTIVRKSIDALM